jgi:hypothetical protein
MHERALETVVSPSTSTRLPRLGHDVKLFLCHSLLPQQQPSSRDQTLVRTRSCRRDQRARLHLLFVRRRQRPTLLASLYRRGVEVALDLGYRVAKGRTRGRRCGLRRVFPRGHDFERACELAICWFSSGTTQTDSDDDWHRRTPSTVIRMFGEKMPMLIDRSGMYKLLDRSRPFH